MSKRLLYFTCMAVAALFVGTVAQAAHDVTAPGDVIVGIPNEGISQNDDHGWPGNEPPHQAIDNQITTKYLHFKGEDVSTGFRVTPKVGPTVVTGIRLCTANDAVPRDPIKWELSGSNESINGPYTLIAAGDIVDFVAGNWQRRTWNTTPIAFANTVSYKHYQLMFPVVQDPGGANSMQIAEVELLEADMKASKPNPADGAVITMPLFQWTKGDTAMFHNVYLGTSPDLTDADLKAPRAMVAMYYHVLPMEPGVTYYWRVDEVDAAGAVIKGDVWSVLVAPKKAYNPSPSDGDKWLPVTTTLSWTPGAGATGHELFFGTDENAVANRDAATSKGKMIAPTFSPTGLVEKTTYYWAVDETTAGTIYKGDVWEFTTLGGGGGVLGNYFAGTAPSGVPALTRIDPEINFTLTGATSPGAGVPGDGWSARWTADLDITVADTYQFSLNCQDGTRMWIDGQLIVDQWITPTVTSEYFAVPIKLDKGIHSLVVEFFDSGGDAVEQMYWSRPGKAKVIVPAGPLQPPVHAQSVYPRNKATDIPQDVVLTWGAGMKAAKHDVYFGDNAQAVADATTASTAVYRGQQKLEEAAFDPGTLEWNKTYYWRIDEVNSTSPDSPWKGSVWSFTTANFLVIDNMEAYTDDDGSRIYQTWIDGFTDGSSGSTVGNIQAPFAERTNVNTGEQALPMDYDNSKAPFYSEAQREFAPAQDWTVNGMNTLVLFARGRVTNGAGQVYVTLEDSAGKSATVTNPDATLVTKDTYTEWKVPLSDFTGVNAAKIKKIFVGVGDRKSPKAGGTGRLYVDDIRVIKP